jgi:hypothetical protein
MGRLAHVAGAVAVVAEHLHPDLAAERLAEV